MTPGRTIRVLIVIIFAILTVLVINIRAKNELIQELKGVDVMRQTVERLQLEVNVMWMSVRSCDTLNQLEWLYARYQLIEGVKNDRQRKN